MYLKVAIGLEKRIRLAHFDQLSDVIQLTGHTSIVDMILAVDEGKQLVTASSYEIDRTQTKDYSINIWSLLNIKMQQLPVVY